MVHTYYYDTNYPGPAFPTVRVLLQNIANSNLITEATAYVDSGADGTIIPLTLLQQIGARKVDEMTLRWGSGPKQRVDIYEVLLQIATYRPQKIYAVGDRHEPQIILGRDVINLFVVTLDGLAGAVEVSQ
jgi:hypothetical protein